VILELLSEAQASGARLAPACRVLGISARTIERWRADPEAGDRRCGPRRRPSNALSPAEEAQVVTVLTSSRYAALSPKELVPQLADEGLYLASESTMYRVQRRYGLRTKKRTTARTYGVIASFFRPGRHLLAARNYREVMCRRFRQWSEVINPAFASQ
jgi:transposase